MIISWIYNEPQTRRWVADAEAYVQALMGSNFDEILFCSRCNPLEPKGTPKSPLNQCYSYECR